VAAYFDEGAVEVVAAARWDGNGTELPARRALETLLRRTLPAASASSNGPEALRRAVHAVAAAARVRVAAIDVGAQQATWTLATDAGDERRWLADGGLAGAARSTSAAALAEALPAAVDPAVVADALQNLAGRPASFPETDRELSVIHAVAVQCASAAGIDALPSGGVDLIVGTGLAIAAAPRLGHAAAMLLDGLRPVGVTQLGLDTACLLGPLGSLADDELPHGLAALRDDLITPLGAAVVTRGGRSGELAMRVRLAREGAAPDGPYNVRHGELLSLPLGRGRAAELEIELENGATLAAPRRTRRARARVIGGCIGVILDARDVPLALPARPDARHAVRAGWREMLLREPAATVTPAR
jgi:hypothetical protein